MDDAAPAGFDLFDPALENEPFNQVIPEGFGENANAPFDDTLGEEDGVTVEKMDSGSPPEPAKPAAKPPARAEPEKPAEREKAAAAPAPPIPREFKQELRSVLSYMDKLLESLPENKIEEFARSEHFDAYKKLFEELGLV